MRAGNSGSAVKISRTERSQWAGFGPSAVLQIAEKKLAPQVGLEATVKRQRKNLWSTDGTKSIRKAVVVDVN
jgi:hypothetical protein